MIGITLVRWQINIFFVIFVNGKKKVEKNANQIYLKKKLLMSVEWYLS